MIQLIRTLYVFCFAMLPVRRQFVEVGPSCGKGRERHNGGNVEEM